jgi:SAM-dependent methyltransferase
VSQGAKRTVAREAGAYDPNNVLDRVSRPETLEVHYEQERRREHELLRRHLPLAGGDVLSVGCGWHPGRHLFPSPAFRMTGVELDEAVVRTLVEGGELDDGLAGKAGELPLPDESFEVVLYRLVLHHVAYQQPLAACFEEARRLLRPGGAMVAVEPGSWHPVGAALAAANRAGLATLVHGTPDDIPLSPRRLVREALNAALIPELHTVTYGWRRLPAPLQRGLHALDSMGSRPRAAPFGHTLMLIARRPVSGRSAAWSSGPGPEGFGAPGTGGTPS